MPTYQSSDRTHLPTHRIIRKSKELSGNLEMKMGGLRKSEMSFGVTSKQLMIPRSLVQTIVYKHTLLGSVPIFAKVW